MDTTTTPLTAQQLWDQAEAAFVARNYRGGAVIEAPWTKDLWAELMRLVQKNNEARPNMFGAFCRGQTEIVHDTSSGNRWTIRLVLPLAKVDDVYAFTYPNEPQFNKTLRVVDVKGDQPESLVFFEDGTHSKQKHLAGVPRVTS